MTRSACLIFNPVAGQGNPEQDLATIQSLLEPEFELEVQLTTEDTDPGDLARDAIARGADAIIASGGDGTLSAVTGATLGTNIPVGIISRGTANAFATALSFPTTIEEACQVIVEGKTRIVDAALCNGKPMVLLAGIGFEAETIEGASREVKNRFGMLAYILSGIQQLRNFEQFEVKIETDDKIITTVAAAVTVANVAPPTSVLAQGAAGIIEDDGLLDITIVAPSDRASAVAASYHLLQTGMRGEAVERDDIGYLRAQRVKISTEPPQKVALDGEPIGKTPIEVECIPQGLTLFVPAILIPDGEPIEKLEDLPNVKIELKEEADPL